MFILRKTEYKHSAAVCNKKTKRRLPQLFALLALNDYSEKMKSRKQFSKACRFMPGGVNSPVRAFGSVDRQPIFIAKGNGSKICDIDGNEYIDYVCSWGALILGHSHPAVVKAVQAAAKKGTSFGAPTIAETALCEMICGAFDSIDKLRLVSSGTEAVMTAVRLAHAFTGRDYILKMSGCYHGHSDSMLVSAGSGSAQFSKPLCPGVPKSLSSLTLVADFNDIDSAARAFKKYKKKNCRLHNRARSREYGCCPSKTRLSAVFTKTLR